MPPQGNEPCYGFHLNIVVSNPDLQYSKTLEKIVITYGNGTPVTQWTPSSEDALISPLEVFERDVRQLNISPPLDHYTFYNVEIYWNGRGQPLIGWTEEFLFLGGQGANGNPIAKDIGQIVEREMVNLSR